MFISLVAERGGGARLGPAYDKRFNGAASRARDPMVLVRPAELEVLRPAAALGRT